ncbi:MAG: hypothetical protein HOQ30_03280 [Gemmatimonadaceae bacterium]|nr:hypothetical protein [Gemmatimonadaceae bacterium]
MEPIRGTDPTLRQLLRRIARRRRLLLAVAVATFVVVAAWTLLATPRYESTAVLRIESKSAIPSLSDAVKELPGMGLAGLAKDELDTDIGVLKSSRIADATIDAMGLAVQVKQPAEDRARVIRVRVLDSSDVEGKITLSRRDDGRYDVQTDDLEGVGKLPAVWAPGDSLRVGSLMLALPENLRAGGPSTIKLRLLPRYKVHKLLDRRLTIRKQEGGSRLVEVSFADPDRRFAAQVVGVMVREYVTYMLQTDEHDETAQIRELRAALGTTAVRLATAEEQLRRFQQRARVVLPTEQAEEQVKRIAAVESRIDAIRIERNGLARLLELIRSRSASGGDPAAYRQLATFPSLVGNRAIQDVLAALTDLESKRSALAVTRTEANVELQQITSRIADLDRQLYRLGSQYLESLDQQLTSTTRTVGTLNDTLVALPATSLQYARLARDRTILDSEYVALYKQLKITELQDVLRKEKVKVVDPPRVANADDPEFPKRTVQLVLGLVLGIVLAFAVGLGVELWTEAD